MSGNITQLADQLIHSYARLGGINHLVGKRLPSRTTITTITVDLLRLLFPGFFDERNIDPSELKPEVVELLDSVAERLQDEIYRSLEYAPPDGIERGKLRTLAHDITFQFLAEIPDIRQRLSSDVEAAYEGDPAARSHEEIIVAYPFVEAISIQRLAHCLHSLNVPLIPRIMTEWAHSRTGMDLHPGARIGTHFFIDHGTGTVIGETCEIGNRVKIYHGVTLGAKSTSQVGLLRGQKRHPTIEDNVTIYPGATILGGGTVIGQDSTIGGNVFLTSSVPPNSLVVFEGVTVKIHSKRNQNSPRTDFQI